MNGMTRNRKNSREVGRLGTAYRLGITHRLDTLPNKERKRLSMYVGYLTHVGYPSHTSIKILGGLVYDQNSNRPNERKVSMSNVFATTGSNTDPDPQKTTPTQSAFDPGNYRKTRQGAGEPTGGKKQGLIPVRKPGNEYFFMAHSSPEYRATLPLLQDKEMGTFYLVHHSLDAPPEVESRVKDTLVTTCVFTGGTVFLWPIPEASNTWAESSRAALAEATGTWIRLHGNRIAGGYDIEYPKKTPKPPVFPTDPFSLILERAFKANLIDSVEHPFVKRLLGDN